MTNDSSQWNAWNVECVGDIQTTIITLKIIKTVCMVTVLVLEVVHRYKKVFVYQYSTYKEAIALQAANLAGYKALQKEPKQL